MVSPDGRPLGGCGGRDVPMGPPAGTSGTAPQARQAATASDSETNPREPQRAGNGQEQQEVNQGLCPPVVEPGQDRVAHQQEHAGAEPQHHSPDARDSRPGVQVCAAPRGGPLPGRGHRAGWPRPEPGTASPRPGCKGRLRPGRPGPTPGRRRRARVPRGRQQPQNAGLYQPDSGCEPSHQACVAFEQGRRIPTGPNRSSVRFGGRRRDIRPVPPPPLVVYPSHGRPLPSTPVPPRAPMTAVPLPWVTPPDVQATRDFKSVPAAR